MLASNVRGPRIDHLPVRRDALADVIRHEREASAGRTWQIE
jgi:hypothetical protein